MTVVVSNEGLLLEGTVYFDRFNSSGVATGLVQVPGLVELTVAPKSDIKESTSRDKGYFGQVISSIALTKPAELKLKFRNATQQGVALALMGTDSTLTEASGTVTDEAVTAKLNKWVELAHRKIVAASVVVTNSAGAVTYVEGTDYEINYDLGMIRCFGSTITDAQSLKVDYGHGAVAGWKVTGGTASQVKGRLILDGRNLGNNNKLVRLEIYQALLTSDGDFNLMSEDLAEFSMSGRMETPAGKSEPFMLEQWT